MIQKSLTHMWSRNNGGFGTQRKSNARRPTSLAPTQGCCLPHPSKSSRTRVPMLSETASREKGTEIDVASAKVDSTRAQGGPERRSVCGYTVWVRRLRYGAALLLCLPGQWFVFSQERILSPSLEEAVPRLLRSEQTRRGQKDGGRAR